jgi:hypothetical protein
VGRITDVEHIEEEEDLWAYCGDKGEEKENEDERIRKRRSILQICFGRPEAAVWISPRWFLSGLLL